MKEIQKKNKDTNPS